MLLIPTFKIIKKNFFIKKSIQNVYSFVFPDLNRNYNLSFQQLFFVCSILTLTSTKAIAQTTTTYTATTTWIAPAGVTQIYVQCLGGGGGGGGVLISGTGGGGAGGAYTAGFITVVPGTSYAVNIGAGGNGGSGLGTSGSAGGNSYFNSVTTILAVGGAGGTGVAGGAGAGGSTTSGNVNIGTNVTNYYGGNGGTGVASTSSGGGGGSAGSTSAGNTSVGATGGTSVTGGGAGANGSSTFVNFSGAAATGIGGGGSGGLGSTGGISQNGGAGFRGHVRITTYYNSYAAAGTYTFTVPTCITTVTVQCWGGGGSGAHGGNPGALQDGGGGGGGAYASSVLTVIPGSTYNVNVGAGGITNCNGNTFVAGAAGEDSWFGSSTMVMAKGGGGGGPTSSTAYLGGTGGTAALSIGTTVNSGGNGGCGNGCSLGAGVGNAGSSGTGNSAGGGGGDLLGAGGIGSGSGGTGGTGGNGILTDGSTGVTAPGGGGGGSATVASGNNNGAAGNVIITYGLPITATIASSNPAWPATNLCASLTSLPIYAFTVALNGGSGTMSFTGFNFITTGNYTTSDLVNFKLWYSTVNDITTATQMSSTLAAAVAGTQTFAGFSQTLSPSATSYFWITTDVAASPTAGHIIAVSAISSSNITMSTCGVIGNSLTGTTSAGASQTLSISTVNAKAQAAGSNTMLNTEILTLTGASFGGSATTAAWLVASSVPAGTHTVSSVSHTTNPDVVTFTPQAAFTGTVVLLLVTNGCSASDTRFIYVIPSSITYTNTGISTWTAPCENTSITVACWGAGGGGGGNPLNAGSSGGGGGGYSRSVIAPTPSVTYTINVGAGGAGGSGATAGNASNKGTTGGSSWFGSTATVLANGGNGGICGNGGAAVVLGGLAGTGTIAVAGGAGASVANLIGGGSGGGEAAGSSGAGATSTSPSNGFGTVGGAGNNADGGDGGAGGNSLAIGTAGQIPGGGGGGAGYLGNPGGAGADGQVKITVSSLTHPITNAGSAITVCQGVATQIGTGASVSNATSVQWSTTNGTGTFGSSTQTITATYTASAADAAAGSITIFLAGVTSCDNVAAAKIITVQAPIATNTVSAAQTICSGNTPSALTGTSPTGGSGSYTYLWESSTTSSTSGFATASGTYTTSGYSPATLTLTTWYRRTVSAGGFCTSNISAAIPITVQAVIASNTASTAQTICSGNTPSALTGTSPTGGSGSYTYLWESSTTSSTSGFVTASGTYTASGYSPGTLTVTTWYRRTVSAGSYCTNNVSSAIVITIHIPITSNTVSVAQTICSGNTPSALTGTSPSGGSGSYTYLWESSTTSSTSGFATASGTYTTGGYSPGALTATTWYRRTVSAGGYCTNDISAAITITVQAVIASNTISSAQTICSGNTPTALTGTSPSGGSGSYTYLWESSTTNSTSGFTTATGTYTTSGYSPGVLSTTNWYRRTVSTGGSCANNVSSVIDATVQSVIAANTINAAQTICSGSTPSALTGTSPTGGSGSYTYLWESSTTSSTSGFTTASGTATTSGYSPSVLSTATWYRRTVSAGGYCTSNVSSVITITVQPVIANNTISTAQTICTGTTPSVLTGTSPSGGSGSYTYLWESSTTSSTSGFTTASGTYTTSGYSPGTVTTDTWYRRSVSSDACSNSPSSVIKITILQNTPTLSYWNGSISTSWFTTGNWCGSLPSTTISAVIPPGTTYSPIISAAGAACLNITINSGSTLTMNTTNTLSVTGNWVNDGTFVAGSSNVYFIGVANQSITGSGTQSFYDLTINNMGSTGNNSVILSQPITVTDKLTLTNGLLATDVVNIINLTNSANTATNGGSATSYIKGPIKWNLTTGTSYVFPTGAGNSKWARVGLSNVSSATSFICQYFNASYSNVSSADIATTPTPSLAAVSKIEHWTVARNVGSGDAAVTLYWENASLSGINSCATDGPLKVAHYNTGGSNKWENANSSGSVPVTGSCSGSSAGTVKSDVMTSFSPFTFGNSGSGVNALPIELLYFDAVFNGETTELKWSTASEINSDYFTVECSADGINFTVVGIVGSKALNGSSTSVLDYTLTDFNDLPPGIYYYRLKQTDFDYKYTYSNLITVNTTKSIDFKFELIPNPGNGEEVKVSVDSPINGASVLTVNDMLGTLLFSENLDIVEGINNLISIKFANQLNSGTYIVAAAMLNSNKLIMKKRLVVTH